MDTDDPFAESDDPDRTVIRRPTPGGQRPAAASPPPSRPVSPEPRTPPSAAPAEGPETIVSGGSPMVAAAAPLLQLIGRLRNTLSQPDPGELRERAVREVRRFEQTVRDAGTPIEQLQPAHYALCAGLDDAVLNTPWGSQGAWANRSLCSTFHHEVYGGERFFELLKQAMKSPARSLPVLELMYLCLALGFQGKYRLSPRGPAELDHLREEVYALLRAQIPAGEPDLSPSWHGVTAPYRPQRARIPLWVAGVAGLAVLAGLFVWLSYGVSEASDQVFEREASAPPATMPQIARGAPVQPPSVTFEHSVLDNLRTFLKPEIDQGLVSVEGTEAAPLIRVKNRGLFPSGSATVEPNFLPLLQKIGTALKTEAGPVDITGYTDNQPIHTVKFPSNFELSTARAQAAQAAIADSIGDASRLRARGMADADPIASNDTQDGRDQNRRIEIVLHRLA